jgi:glycosyltransferase involved in cell wall biosynthesis
MKCLHIANDFSLTKVHKNLYTLLDDLGLEQIIFNPVRENTPVGNNRIPFKTVDSQIIYSKKIKKYHRILFRNKIDFLFRDLESNIDFTNISLIHATTLFSDGAIALRIYKKYNIPYIVAIRGTDVSLFLKYRPDLIFLLKEILTSARKIIFLGEALKETFLKNRYTKLLGLELQDKIVVISNGIDDFWLSSVSPKKKQKPNKLLYIGRFDGNKNTLNLIDAIIKLRDEFPEIKLDLVGKGGSNEDKVIEISNLHNDFVKYYGPIYDKSELQKIYLSNHIFAMPSFSETFGLVYLEALSQGLPILCSKNQGIDGTFDMKIGEFVDPKSVDSIYYALKQMILNYDVYELDKIDFSNFRWQKIAQTYLQIYENISTS